MTTETNNVLNNVEYEYELWQHGAWQAGGRENDYASAQSEANHYAMLYAHDGPVEVRIYEKRLLSADKVEAKRRRYDPYGSLSEYGIFPECNAQSPADAEVVFIDGVGAGRSSIKACRDGVQWIRVGDRVYWPLSDSDAKRLQSACCGNGSFDGSTTHADEALLQKPAVVDDAMVERACRHWYAQWDKADQATKGVWAKTMHDLLTAAIATQQQQQPAEGGERDWLEEAMFDALFGGKEGT